MFYHITSPFFLHYVEVVVRLREPLEITAI